MNITIDTAGRVVLPKAIRDAAGLKPGLPLEVRCRDGRVEIEPTHLDVNIVDQGGVAVAVATPGVGTLSGDIVEQIIQSVRGERG